MNCTHHIQNPVSLICIAPHNCSIQRKMCVECQYEHGVDLKYTLPIRIFENIVKINLTKYQIDEKQNLEKERMKHKQMLSQTESIMRNILKERSELFSQIFDRIEIENSQFGDNLIDENTNLAQIPYSNLEILVQISQGNMLNNFITQKCSYLDRLEKSNNYWDQEVKAFDEKLKQEMNDIVSLFKIKPIQLEQHNKNQNNGMVNEIIEKYTKLVNEYERLYLWQITITKEYNIIDKKYQELVSQLKLSFEETQKKLLKYQLEQFLCQQIFINVKSFSTNVSQTFQMLLTDSISDLYILAVQEGIHKGSPLDCCLFVPSKNIRYASSEWNQKFQKILIPNDSNVAIQLEFIILDDLIK